MGVGPQPTMASMQQQMRWQPHGMAPGHQQPMAPQMRINMPYNPMSMAPKYPMYPPPSSIMYKNPMMPMGGYGYPPGPPPPPAPQNQGKGPGNPPYDPYMYQRQWKW